MQNDIRRRYLRALPLILATLCFGATLGRQASAGCLSFQSTKKSVSYLTPGSLDRPMGFVKVSDQGSGWGWAPPIQRAPIVGLWAFKYISMGNFGTLGIKDGTILDGGNTLWYADGNENTVSGVRDPETGDVCLGVWKRTGEWTYELNHIGLSWDPTTHLPGGPAFIKQHVTLGTDGNSYTGTFAISQLDPDGKTLSTPAPIVGNIVATRVGIDTTTQEPLP
jgi:hypothetical protein